MAVSGFFSPILFGLPYIIILWGIVGLNVDTDQELYIARYIEQTDMDLADFSVSTTLNHWAVVIREGNRYFYTHAVGNVVSGEGRKIPFREMEGDVRLRYRLDRVGFVTQNEREERTRELVDDEPMVSGNSCQEYAVDIAFQLSSSRTYTFAKIMALPRMRNTVLFIAVALSIAFVVSDLPYARVLNPFVVINLFAAWELSRIGIHNQAQKVNLRYISSVFRAYSMYPGRGDFFVLMFICVAFVYLFQRLDSGEFIVISTLLFAVVLVLLRRPAFSKSAGCRLNEPPLQEV